MSLAEKDEKSHVSTAMARVAMNSKRYRDAANFMKETLRAKGIFNYEEQEMFSEIYKSLINSSRNALIVIDSSLETSSQLVSNAMYEHRKILIEELVGICQEVINLVDSALLPALSDVRSVIFYNKIKGDYFRYMAEYIISKEVAETQANRAKTAYETALVSLGDELKMSDPLYLGLVLNYSVFQHDILKLREEAIERADSAFNEAVRYLEEINDQDLYYKATMLLQLLRDNISAWKDERNDDSR